MFIEVINKIIIFVVSVIFDKNNNLDHSFFILLSKLSAHLLILYKNKSIRHIHKCM